MRELIADRRRFYQEQREQWKIGEPDNEEAMVAPRDDKLSLFDRLAAGETTMRSELEQQVEALAQEPGKRHLADYTDMTRLMGELSSQDPMEWDDQAEPLSIDYGTRKLMVGVSVAATVIFLPLSFLGPLPIQYMLFALYGACMGAAVGKWAQTRDVMRRPHEHFAPVYEAADVLDQDIGLCYAVEHYIHNRERFALTYGRASDEAREYIDEQLYAQEGDIDRTELEYALAELKAA